MKTNPTQITASVLFLVFVFYFTAQKKYMITAICAVALASYVVMNLDMSKISQDPQDPHQDYIARYVDWSITTPLLLFTLLRACRLQNPSLYVLILTLDVMMIYMGYLAAVADTVQKRNTLFAASSFFYLLVFVLVFWICSKTQLGLGLFLFLAWMVYPVLWYLHRVPDTEPYLNNNDYNSCIAALDVFSKVGYGLLLPL